MHDATLDRTTDRTGPVARPDARRSAGGGRRIPKFTPDGGRTFPFRGTGRPDPDAGRGALGLSADAAADRDQGARGAGGGAAGAACRRMRRIGACSPRSTRRRSELFDEPPFARGASGAEIAALYRAALLRRPPAARALPAALGARAGTACSPSPPRGSSPPPASWAARCTCGPWMTPPPPGRCGRGGWRAS